jgi:multiple sugar transport system permease protein
MDLNDPKTFSRLALIPALALLYFLGIFPLVLEVYVSFTNWSPISGNWWDSRLIGVNNYVETLTNPLFGWAILHTIIIAASAVTLEFALGLVLAVLLQQQIIGKRIFTSIFILPMMSVPAISGYIFYMMFLSSGPINAIISAITQTPVTIQWLNDPVFAVVAVILMDVWQWTPLMFLILLSGLLALPAEPVEAAKVLGASSWRIFRQITLPALKPIIIIALAVRTMEALKLFDGVWILTHGGPVTATQTISVYLYQEGFLFLRYGYIASASVLVLLGLIFFTRRLIKPLGLVD